MAEIIYSPRVYLFAFHLFKTPNLNEHSAVKDPDLLWDKCNSILSKFYVKQALQLKTDRPDNQRIALLVEEKPDQVALDFKPEVSHKGEALNLEGFAYPLQLYDSYALGLKIGFPDPIPPKGDEPLHLVPVDISVLEELNPNYCFLQDSIESNLGQSLIVTSWLTSAQHQRSAQSLNELADEHIRSFIPEPAKRPTFSRQGTLFGSPIFEYELTSNPETYQQVLVWLFTDSITDTTFRDSYNTLLDLWFYRNKVITEFQNSRVTYRNTYKEYETVERFISSIFNALSSGETLTEDDLKHLKNQLKKLVKKSVEYSGLLRDFEFRRNSIFIHSDNYKTKLKLLQRDLKSHEDLTFLERFSAETTRAYQEQIQADIRYFVQGSRLLEKAIDSIRGIVAIDQAERDRQREQQEQQRREDADAKEKARDRQMQVTIFAAGSAVTVGGILASTAGQVTPSTPVLSPWSTGASRSLHPFITFTILSIFVAVVAGFIAWKATSKLQNSKWFQAWIKWFSQ